MQLIGISRDRAVNPFNFSITCSILNLQKQIYASLLSCHSYFSYVERVAYSIKLGPETPWAMLTIRNHINTFNNGMAAKYKHSVVNEASNGVGTRGAGLYC